MSDKSTMEKQLRGEATDSAIELVIAAERQRCIDRVLVVRFNQLKGSGEFASVGIGDSPPSLGRDESESPNPFKLVEAHY